MRLTIPAAAALAILAAQITPTFAQAAFAQTAVAQTAAAPAPVTPAAPAAAASPTPAAPAETTAPAVATPKKHVAKHIRMTLMQRFTAANTTHDGHLTSDQAGAAKWTYVASHFDAIDSDHKGYVTVANIQAFAKTMRAERAARKAATTPASAAPATPAPAAKAPATTN